MLSELMSNVLLKCHIQNNVFPMERQLHLLAGKGGYGVLLFTR